MTGKPLHPGGNSLIDGLAPAQQRPFLENAATVSLEAGKVLSDSEQPIHSVYFPTTAVLSVLSVTTNRVAVETAVVGCEGMAPLGAFNRVDSATEQVIVQVPGEALRMSRQDFHKALGDVPAMRSLLHRFSQVLFTFAAQSSACNRQHSVVQRCARWLLTTHDRVPGDAFYLTHLFLSRMLGVRRSSVTIAAEALRAAGAITYTRGKVRIVDRNILEQRACECYAIIRSTYDRVLTGPSTPSPRSAIELSSGETPQAGNGLAMDPRQSPTDGAALVTEESFLEFTARLRDARRRNDEFRSLAELRNGDFDRADLLRLSEELSSAFEQLETAEEEMRVQMHALTEMRFAMETQAALWHARFDGLPDAFIETDQDEIIVELNRAAEDLIGRLRRLVIGKPLVTLFPDTDRRGLRQVISQLKSGAGSAHWTGTMLGSRNGPTVDVAVTVSSHRALVANVLASREHNGKYLGARWLLRAQRDTQRSVF